MYNLSLFFFFSSRMFEPTFSLFRHFVYLDLSRNLVPRSSHSLRLSRHFEYISILVGHSGHVILLCARVFSRAAAILKSEKTLGTRLATIFDPLGFGSPFVAKAKILLQELWSRGYDWDDVIHDEIASRIGSWYEQLKSLGNVKVARCLREAKELVANRVVTFVDASLQAYGTVVYLQCVYNDATTTSRLITSKCKVAPLKSMTVPRLELMGAVLGLRLTQRLAHVLGLPMQTVTFYSDSMDVLWWIRGHGRSFRPFIANRIGEIQMVTEPSQWQHVATGENPANLCTRGATPEELMENSLWWHGPKWLLSKDKQSWPKMDLRSRPASLPEIKMSKSQGRGRRCRKCSYLSCTDSDESRREEREE